jgi:hypothetical protein
MKRYQFCSIYISSFSPFNYDKALSSQTYKNRTRKPIPLILQTFPSLPTSSPEPTVTVSCAHQPEFTNKMRFFVVTVIASLAATVSAVGPCVYSPDCDLSVTYPSCCLDGQNGNALSVQNCGDVGVPTIQACPNGCVTSAGGLIVSCT